MRTRGLLSFSRFQACTSPAPSHQLSAPFLIPLVAGGEKKGLIYQGWSLLGFRVLWAWSMLKVDSFSLQFSSSEATVGMPGSSCLSESAPFPLDGHWKTQTKERWSKRTKSSASTSVGADPSSLYWGCTIHSKKPSWFWLTGPAHPGGPHLTTGKKLLASMAARAAV